MVWRAYFLLDSVDPALDFPLPIHSRSVALEWRDKPADPISPRREEIEIIGAGASVQATAG